MASEQFNHTAVLYFLNWYPIMRRLSESVWYNVYTTRTHAKTSYDMSQPMAESGVVGSTPHHTIGMHSAKNGTVKNNYLFDRINKMSDDVRGHCQFVKGLISLFFVHKEVLVKICPKVQQF